MKPETVSLLCGPGTREPLRLVRTVRSDGGAQEELIAEGSGRRFGIRDGIPLLLDQTSVTGFNKRYQGLYNHIANLYDGSIRLFALAAGSGEEGFRREYLRELELRDRGRMLEVSIGTGANLHFLPRKGSFFGLDISWGMLKRSQRNLSRWNIEAELILGNAEELPFVDEAFDTVLHVGGINAFNDRSRALAEMSRVAKPGTKIVVVDETAKLIESFGWIPSARSWLRDHGERFAAPVALVPAGMHEVHAGEIAKGNLYCLTFRKP